jgi:hypothetical protein
MTIRGVPTLEVGPIQPSLGIFWRVSGVLVIDRSILADGEPYGACLTHAAGHYERWENWRALGAERLRAIDFPDLIASTEYEEWPRGRIIYEKVAKRFVLYADRRLQKPDVIDALKRAFGLLEAEVTVMSDFHYR